MDNEDATVAGTLDKLTLRGFREDFRAVNGRLQVVATGERLRPEDLVMLEFYRFEGFSDPDDMAIVYGIESRSGARGTVVDAFGVYADPVINEVLREVPIRRSP